MSLKRCTDEPVIRNTQTVILRSSNVFYQCTSTYYVSDASVALIDKKCMEAKQKRLRTCVRMSSAKTSDWLFDEVRADTVGKQSVRISRNMFPYSLKSVISSEIDEN